MKLESFYTVVKYPLTEDEPQGGRGSYTSDRRLISNFNKELQNKKVRKTYSTVEKWAMDLKIAFSKEEIKIANKYFRMYLIS